MTHRIRGLSIATAGAVSVLLAAQSSTSSATPQGTGTDKARHDVTVTGCVAKSADGRFMLTNATIEPAAPAATTGTTSAGATATGTTTAGTTSPSMPAVDAMNTLMTWTLAGGSDLDQHLGYKIQVTGLTTWDASKPAPAAPMPVATTGTAGATTTTAGTTSDNTTTIVDRPLVDVRTVKMLSASCP
jgi:hypothetical protein